MGTRAKITLRDGTIHFVSVMFPNSPYWAEQYRLDPRVRRIEQLPAKPD
jgi:hypothetical protein